MRRKLISPNYALTMTSPLHTRVPSAITVKLRESDRQIFTFDELLLKQSNFIMWKGDQPRVDPNLRPQMHDG